MAQRRDDAEVLSARRHELRRDGDAEGLEGQLGGVVDVDAASAVGADGLRERDRADAGVGGEGDADGRGVGVVEEDEIVDLARGAGDAGESPEVAGACGEGLAERKPEVEVRERCADLSGGLDDDRVGRVRGDAAERAVGAVADGDAAPLSGGERLGVDGDGGDAGVLVA